MANRHVFRTMVLQSLYEWDMRGGNNLEIPTYTKYIASDFYDGEIDDVGELTELTENIAKKASILNEIIEKAAPDWKLEKMTTIDRNILRLGLYELLFGDRERVPAKVAINEAVDLAKHFGGPKSGKFVNGVIGAVYREIGEPGKDDAGKKKMAEVPYEDMPIDQKGGAVVYSVDVQGMVRIGMVHDVFGFWTLSKGSIAEDESVEDGTKRRIGEETDWSITIEEKLGSNEYIAYHPERGPVRKQVEYFLARSEYTKPTLEKGTGGLDDVRWFDLADIADLSIYDDVSQMIMKSLEILMEKGILTSGLEETSVEEEPATGDQEAAAEEVSPEPSE